MMNKITLFKKFHIYKNIFEMDTYNTRKIDLYKFENCTTTGLNLYYPNILLKSKNTLILPLLERTMSLKSGTIYEKNNMEFNNNDGEKKIVNIKLLMQFPNEQKKVFYPFVMEFLEILNISKDEIVMVDEYTEYKELYVSTSYTHDFDSNLPPRKEIYDFYQNIVHNVKEKNMQVETPKKIYVSRRTWLHNDFSNIGTNYTTRRRLVNEDDLVEKLLNEGYCEVFTEKLSTIEKILYFANATHVVGAIGGGISNVLFSPKTTKLEAIVSPTFLDVNTRFKYSLDCVNVSYNMNTEHVEKTEFKTYMRVKTKDGTIVGEIEKIHDNKLLVSYTDGSNTGWNAQCNYKQIELNKNDVVKLDDGLNSMFRIILQR